ncbi:MAG TPA: CcmD family protein [Acidobacteriota bacterium]|jgi:CcmD family protein
MSHPGFLFAGFALAWAVAFAYVWLLSRRAATLEQRLEALQRRLEEAGD